MIDTRTLTTIQLAEPWVTTDAATRGADRYGEIARHLNGEANRVEHRDRREARFLRDRAHVCQTIADELRQAVKAAEARTIDGRAVA